MNSFTYCSPTKVLFGEDTECRIARCVKECKSTRAMLVYGGRFAEESGLLGRMREALEEAGIAYLPFGGAKPNPVVSHVREGIARAVEFGADLVVGIGGGSAIDTAKAIAHGAANPGKEIWDIWTGRERLRESLPIGVVLTIAAAGSELSNSAVLTNEELGRKQGLTTELNRPAFAIMNPALTVSVPYYQKCCGIADIMMHTMERYLGREDNALTDALAEALLRTVVEQAKKIMENPMDLDALSELMWAGSLSHSGLTGLGGQGDWACHKLGHELSAKFGVTHGASLTAVWPAWAAYVYPQNQGRFQKYAKYVWGIEEEGETAVKKAIEETKRFFESLSLPVCLEDAIAGASSESPAAGAVPDEVLRELAFGCSGQGQLVVGHARELFQEDIYQIYRNACKGHGAGTEKETQGIGQ